MLLVWSCNATWMCSHCSWPSNLPSHITDSPKEPENWLSPITPHTIPKSTLNHSWIPLSGTRLRPTANLCLKILSVPKAYELRACVYLHLSRAFSSIKHMRKVTLTSMMVLTPFCWFSCNLHRNKVPNLHEEQTKRLERCYKYILLHNFPHWKSTKAFGALAQLKLVSQQTLAL